MSSEDAGVVDQDVELDLALCVRLAPELDAALHSPVRAVVIDLAAVSLVDSSGIALLINAFLRLDESGRQLAISCSAGSQLRAFEVTALDRELPMYETREDALAAVGGS